MTDLHTLKLRAALQWPDLVRYLDGAKIEPVLTLYGGGGQVLSAPECRDMLTVTVFDRRSDEHSTK